MTDIETLEQEARQMRARMDRLKRERDAMLADMKRCYQIMLAEPSAKAALDKAERFLSDAIIRAKVEP